MSLSQFTLFGERCSGTNYLRQLMEKNFTLQHTDAFGNKHCFKSYHFGSNPSSEDSTLFLCIVRDPLDWLDSFHRNPYHIPEHLQPADQFFTQPLYSATPECHEFDLHLRTGQRYRDIFELRQTKLAYMQDTIRAGVKHYCLLRYEDLRDRTFEVLQQLETQFGLVRRSPNLQNIIVDSKGNGKTLHKKKPNCLAPEWRALALERLDMAQEQSLGYLR